jgi:mono/diheme cytochrome c family protein
MVEAAVNTVAGCLLADPNPASAAAFATPHAQRVTFFGSGIGLSPFITVNETSGCTSKTAAGFNAGTSGPRQADLPRLGGATCAGCHGSDAIGTPVGPDLASGKWLWGDGSVESITQTIANGVPEPKEHPGAMPPMGGVTLPETDLKAVAAYVWAVGHQRQE